MSKEAISHFLYRASNTFFDLVLFTVPLNERKHCVKNFPSYPWMGNMRNPIFRMSSARQLERKVSSSSAPAVALDGLVRTFFVQLPRSVRAFSL